MADNRTRSNWLLLMAVVVGAAVIAIGASTVALRTSRAAKKARPPPVEPAHFGLPLTTLDASRVLGRSVADVHAALGAPAARRGDVEEFQRGVPIEVQFDADRAVALTVTAPSAARNERIVRKWLHLPQEGGIAIGSDIYEAVSPNGEDDRITIRERHISVVDAVPAAASPPGPRRTVISAESVLKAFPRIPAGLRAACKRAPKLPQLSCSPAGGAKFSYALDEQQEPQTLTILDPPGSGTEAQCSAILEAGLSGALPAHRADTPRRRSMVYSGAAFDALYVWSPAGGFQQHTTCSILACRKAIEGKLGGARSACVPPG